MSLDELRALEQAATPGPWYADLENYDDLAGFGSIWRVRWACRILVADEANERRLADAALVVAARNALPGLLGRVAAAEAERNALRSEVSWVRMALGWAVFRDDSRVWASNEMRDIQARLDAVLAASASGVAEGDA